MQIKEFNNQNRWKKRGINLLPMLYAQHYAPFRYNVVVAIYHGDGSVSVTHGGVECGQGINTKVTSYQNNEIKFANCGVSRWLKLWLTS